jgi:hypothetical protein
LRIERNHPFERLALFGPGFGGCRKREPYLRQLGAMRRQRTQQCPRGWHIALLARAHCPVEECGHFLIRKR